MRTWRLPGVGAAAAQYPDAPLASTVQERGLCLMTIEFLSRYPSAECVVTSLSLAFWDFVFDQFPKTLFHVFSSPLEDPPRPNVIRHAARFDSRLAEKFGARGAPYNLLFTVEDMQAQMALYLHGKPVAALLLVTQPAQEYIEGELVYPLYSSPYSGLCGLIPSPGQARVAPYGGYYAAMLEFHARARGPGSGYDRAAEDAILQAHARGISGLGGAEAAKLMVEVTRSDLPRLQDRDVVFWEPPAASEPQIKPNELEELLLAAIAAKT
jgi:hypothetical protein